MKNRQFFTLAFVLVLALILAACGGAAEPTAAPAPTKAPAAEPTAEPAAEAAMYGDLKVIPVEDGAEIVFSGWGDETEQNIYRTGIESFMEFYPNVKVDFQPIPADFQTKLKAQMAGGAAPDVFYVDDQLMVAFAPSGQIVPLDDAMAEAGASRDDFMPSLLTIFTMDDKTYALPKDWGTLGLVYLPEAFEAAGIDEPTADWGWDELKAAAEALQAEGTYAGFCQNADWARFAPFAFGNGGSYANDDFTTAMMDTPEVKEAAQFIADMKESGALITASDVGAGWCGEAIGKELVGMTYEGGWMVNYMRDTYPDVNWEAQPVAAGPVQKANVIFTNGIGVNAHSEYPQAAAALAIFLTSRYTQGQIVETGFAYSTHPDQADLVKDVHDAAIAKGGDMPGTRVAYWGANTGKINDLVSKALEAIYLGAATVDEAFDEANAEAQKLLDAQNK